MQPQPSPDQLAGVVGAAAGRELAEAMEKIQHCVGQLTDEQLWWRPDESMNSIANLMLHLGGNVRQWIIASIGGAEDRRDRPREFSERGSLRREELLGGLQTTVAEARAVLSSVSAAELQRVRRIQAFEVNGIETIFHSVSHFRGHTQEIVHQTRSQLGPDYKFAFVP